MSTPDDHDPFSPDTIASPWEFYAALREHAPVYPLEQTGYSLVSRYDDCRAAALDTDTFSSNLVAMVVGLTGQAPALLEVSPATTRPVDVLAIADEPVHARQRKVANSAMTPRRVAAMEDGLRGLAGQLVETFIAHDSSDDWMQAVANEMPVQVVCRLLGLPLEDRVQLRSWANDGSALLSGVLNDEQLARYAASVMKLNAYLADAFRAARDSPGDNVLGVLARATREDEDFLSEDEVVAILLQLLSAGSESTAGLLGSAALLLARDPQLQQALRADPSAIPDFIEETLRLESPFQGHFRLATRDCRLGDVEIASGTRLMLLWGSANRDPSQFADPDRLRPGRDNASAHLAFGLGIHHCIGAALARMETRVALEELLARTRSFELADQDQTPSYLPSVMIRRLGRLPLTATPR